MIYGEQDEMDYEQRIIEDDIRNTDYDNQQLHEGAEKLPAILVPEFSPIVKQSGLDKAENYAAIFAPFMIELKNLSNKAAAITKENPSVLDAKLAREVRLAMARNRTASEKEKDKNKASLIAEGNLIQGLYKVVESASKISEADLEAIEKFAENKEKERKQALIKERVEILKEFINEDSAFSINHLDIGGMDEASFNSLLEGQKLLREKRRADAAEQEARRIQKLKEQEEEQRKIKLENQRLKAEKDLKYKRNKELRPYIIFIREYDHMVALNEELYQKELKEIQKAAEEHWEQERKDQIKKQKDEDEKNDKLRKIELENNRLRAKAALQKKEQDKKDLEEANKKALELEAKRKAEQAPDREKLFLWVKASNIDRIPVTEESEFYETAELIYQKFAAFKLWATTVINKI